MSIVIFLEIYHLLIYLVDFSHLFPSLLTNQISKIFEATVRDALVSHLESNDLNT